ncbi:MAG: serine hydrolase [Deltaproteobacteria bacterium]|nr:serine hydrolase [Deltaproteobacteria bacterium]
MNSIAILILGGCSYSFLNSDARDTNQVFYYPPVTAEEGNWERTSPENEGWDPQALERVFEYARAHNSSGLVIIKNGRILAERKWELKNPLVWYGAYYEDIWFHGRTPDGWAREDVASTQKSIISILAGIACDKKLLDLDAPVSTYLGPGWSKATPGQEAAIKVRHLLAMSSGITEKLEYEFPAGEDWKYINKAYSLVNEVIQVATGKLPNEFTREWLTGPLGMAQTEWIVRSEFFRQWNMNGLVTTARDLARFGLMIQAGGTWNGRQIVSQAYLEQALSPSQPHNPAYGLLWWLNNPEGFEWGRSKKGVETGKFVPDAPGDMIAAMGTSERRVYVVPSLGLVVTRTGSSAKLDDKGQIVNHGYFDRGLWRLLRDTMPSTRK